MEDLRRLRSSLPGSSGLRKVKKSTSSEGPRDSGTHSLSPDWATSLSFLDLPGEVRNKILRLLLTHRTRIVIHHYGNLKPPQNTALQLHPNILLTCQTNYCDGLTILYGENVFQVHPMLLTSLVFAIDFDRPIRTHYIPHVCRFHIRVRLDSDPFYPTNAVKAAFNNAEVLEVEIFRSSFRAGDYRALDGFTLVRGVKEAKVFGSIERGFARWLEKSMMSAYGEDLLAWEPRSCSVDTQSSQEVPRSPGSQNPVDVESFGQRVLDLAGSSHRISQWDLR